MCVPFNSKLKNSVIMNVDCIGNSHFNNSYSRHVAIVSAPYIGYSQPFGKNYHRTGFPDSHGVSLEPHMSCLRTVGGRCD